MTSPSSSPVLFVEDDDELRLATTQALELAGFEVQAFAGARAVLPLLSRAFDGAIVSDIRMPEMDGLELLAAVKSIDRGIPLILVTGHGDVPLAVRALKDGAFDFLSKPFATDHLVAAVQRALDHRALQVENSRLRAAAELNDPQSPLVGNSIAMGRLRASIRQLAAADVDVLIEGETGVGKEVVAALLHRMGPRAGKPFIAVNCAAWVDSSFELQLFGHSSDSLPYTRLPRKGLIAASGGGSLLLDEVDSIPFAMQARLLRVLEEREVQPLGAERPESVNLHVIATSKIDLEKAAATGQFRADLFHRLATSRLRVPPLREREDDVILLFNLFVEEAKEQFGRANLTISESATARLRSHEWPGNVRELRNYAFSIVLEQEGHRSEQGTAPRSSLRERVAEFEAAAIREALHENQGNVSRAIEQLGLPRKTFYDKVARLSIDLSRLRKEGSS